MKILYSDALRQASDLFALAQRATRQLEEVTTPSAQWATAEWDRGTDEQGRDVLLLRISDWSGAVTARFSPAEWANGDELKGRLNWLWGKLLQIRSHKLLDRVLESMQSASGASDA